MNIYLVIYIMMFVVTFIMTWLETKAYDPLHNRRITFALCFVQAFMWPLVAFARAVDTIVYGMDKSDTAIRSWFKRGERR